MFTKSELQNQSTLITIPNPNTQAVTVLVMFPVGSRYESQELNGVSHFIEHMMFKGTEKRPTTLDISKELDGLGAEYNAYTSKDYTGYYVRIDASKIEVALDIVSDMLWNSIFDAQEIEREKGVIAEELHMYEDNPMMDVEEFLEQQIFAGSPLGWKIGGTDKIIHTFTREGMVGFRDRFYTPDQMTVVVAGNMPENISERAEEYFGGAQREPSNNIEFIKHEFIDSPQVALKWKETEQAVMTVGFRAYSYQDEKLYALKLLHVILGGSMSSRLFIEVRERRGLAYVIRTDVSPYHETGAFSVKAGLLPEKCGDALKTIIAELKKVRDEGVTEEELAQAKQHMRGRITLALENSSTLAEWYAKQWALKNTVDTPEEQLAKLDAVTLDNIQEVAQEVVEFDNMKVAVIGPFKDDTVFTEAIKESI